MAKEGAFRQDLLYRINTVEMEIPPLRERPEDIPALSVSFLERYAQKYRKKKLQLPEHVIRKLQKFEWPGNVRELQHAIENIVIMSESDTISPEHVNLVSPAFSEEQGLNLENVEKNTIRKALLKYNGNYSTIAAELGISRTTLYHKIRKYGL